LAFSATAAFAGARPPNASRRLGPMPPRVAENPNGAISPRPPRALPAVVIAFFSSFHLQILALFQKSINPSNPDHVNPSNPVNHGIFSKRMSERMRAITLNKLCMGTLALTLLFSILTCQDNRGSPNGNPPPE